MVFTAFCGRALWRALYRALCVHCTCTVQNTVCAILLLEAWRHILCLWVAAVKVNVSLDWGCGTCKREFVQACVCTARNQKKLVLLCLLGSSFEDESVFGLRLWQVQKVVCSSLCLHIRTVNQKIFPGLSPGSSKKTAILSNSLRRNLHAPFPQFNVVTSLCFERPSKKTAISVRMPACIGQQHWSRGRGGIRCDVTTCRRMAVFFEEPGMAGSFQLCERKHLVNLVSPWDRHHLIPFN